jgi:nucleoside-diphosphate kinase
MAQNETFYTFGVEWFDTQANLVRQYNLRFYLNDGQIDLFDVKAKRTFLKKCQYPSVTLADLYIGSQITVYARQLKVVAYADEYTRKHLEDAKKVGVVASRNQRGNTTILIIFLTIFLLTRRRW